MFELQPIDLPVSETKKKLSTLAFTLFVSLHLQSAAIISFFTQSNNPE